MRAEAPRTLPWDTTETDLRYFWVISMCNKITLDCHRDVSRVWQGCHMSFLVWNRYHIDDTFSCRYLPQSKTIPCKCVGVTLLLRGCNSADYMSVPVLLHGSILREIDVTLITRHIHSHFEIIINQSKTTAARKSKQLTDIFPDVIIHGHRTLTLQT